MDQEAKDKMVQILEAAGRTCDLWVGQYNRYQDGPGLKNAIFALGKLYGAYNILLNFYRGENVPERALDYIQKYQQAFDDLMGTPVELPAVVA